MKKMNLVRAAAALVVAGTVVCPMVARADDGPFLVRLRAVQLKSQNSDNTGLNLSINDKVIPELDVSYFFTPQIAAELILTYPQSQSLRSNGSEIGTLKHLPPTLTVQYHFTGMGIVTPYVGVGVNYTHFSSVKFQPAVVTALHPSVSDNSYGLAAQLGADVEVAKNTYLNFDIKKVQIHTDVSSSGTKVGTFRVDPWLFGVGVGMRF